VEWRKFCEHFKVNIQEYRWIEEESRATPLGRCYFIDKRYPTFNILQVILSNGKPHSAFIADLNRVANICFCPKCQQIVCKNDTKHQNETFKRHLASCDGTWHKRLKLDLTEKPYAPHLFEKRATNATRNYITFDFEIVREIVREKSKKTTIGAVLHPLSVACCLRFDGDLEPYYYDLKGNNDSSLGEVYDGSEFVDKFIAKLFDLAEIFEEEVVNVIGFNSSKFDLQLFLQGLVKCGKVKCLGTTSQWKDISVTGHMKTLRFIDARLLVSGGSLKDFIKNFGGEDAEEKGLFPYEAFDLSNYKKILDKSEPFEYEDFKSYLKQKNTLEVGDYAVYLYEARNFPNRWEYLKFYNIKDVTAMIQPLDKSIELNWQYGVDTLKSVSLSANASAIKYSLAYKDFDVNADYSIPTILPPFTFTKKWFEARCESYKKQDLKAKKPRDVAKNIALKDYEEMKRRFDENPRCHLCKSLLTSCNKPSFDRIDCNISHQLDNLLFACKDCNNLRWNKSIEEARVLIQANRYALQKSLPMTITNEAVYWIIRKGITGGLANVMHRTNLKGITHINKLFTDGDYIFSENNEHIMTHVCGVDFNSLYPSSFSSIPNKNIPYTDGKMWMPGRVKKFLITTTEAEKKYARQIIEAKRELFIVELVGHIDNEFLDDFVNFPPIFRKVDIELKEEVIGIPTFRYMVDNKLLDPTKAPRKENKLTMLLSTHGKIMSFSSYYLWFLIDRCHFIIDDITSITLFTKHDAFRPFVEEMMDKRIRNKEIEQFYKTTMNGSYGYDGMNTEKFSRNRICNTHDAQICIQHLDFQGISVQIDDDTWIVNLNPKSFRCKTPIQCAYFTLDNAKYWYLNFVYNFMYRCLDMEKIHFIEGDTDSAYWAIAGNPEEDKHQQFKYVIKDKEFYEEHYADWFPDPKVDHTTLEGKKEEKKLLGLTIENESDNMVALSPKCYIPFDGMVEGFYTAGKFKVKGVNKAINPFTERDYFEALQHPVRGKNIGFQVKDGKQTQVKVKKSALTAVHTKMVVDENQACLPFLKLT
jgi:hypothetical protein